MSDPASQAPDSSAARGALSRLGRLKNIWVEDFATLRPRLMFCTLLARLLPECRAVDLRTRLVRGIGLDIGEGTRFQGMPIIQSGPPGSLRPRLRIGRHCQIGRWVILEFADVVTLGDHVSLEDGAVILTTTHELGPKEHRAGTFIRHPVVIGNNVVIGAGAIILPGAKIGDAARVLPGSVVNGNVVAGATVSGIPARPLRAT